LAPQENPVVSQLKSYHRLFYRNEVIKGLLFSLLAIACLGSIFILIEYFAWLSSPLRGILYYLFLSASVVLLVSNCLTPIIKWTNKISPDDLEFMAKKLGKFFDKPHQDELINILQLQSDGMHKVNSPLLEAAITQKYVNYLAINLLILLIIQVTEKPFTGSFFYSRYWYFSITLILNIFVNRL
jgi:hypothetical protein